MTVDGILAPGDILVGLRAAGKHAVLEALAGRAAETLGLGVDAILPALLRREALGSTGMGDGVALPHARLDAVRRPFGMLARLRDPIDFEAVDDRPIDLVFLLLLPAGAEDRHLSALACVTRWLRTPGTAAGLRGARDAALYALVGGRTLSRA